MKLNLHKSPLYFYILVGEYDAIRKITLFESFDETLHNYNINCSKYQLKYTQDNLYEITNSKINYNENLIKNFYSEFFK